MQGHIASAQNLKILIVDDSEVNRILIKEFLKNSSFIISEAENGMAAVEMAKSEKFDVILMDMQMPILDGYSATKQIREWEEKNKTPHSHIIAVTAYGLKEDQEKSLHAGCDHHLSKPIMKKDLLPLLNQEQT